MAPTSPTSTEDPRAAIGVIRYGVGSVRQVVPSYQQRPVPAAGEQAPEATTSALSGERVHVRDPGARPTSRRAQPTVRRGPCAKSEGPTGALQMEAMP